MIIKKVKKKTTKKVKKNINIQIDEPYQPQLFNQDNLWLEGQSDIYNKNDSQFNIMPKNLSLFSPPNQLTNV